LFLKITLRDSENWMLRRIFGPKSKNMPGERWEMRPEEFVK
jgi:hypothetical protein